MNIRIKLLFSSMIVSFYSAGLLAGSAFGAAEDVSYAHSLWDVLVDKRMAGDNQKPMKPFFGGAKPHGMILELAYEEITVNGYKGFVVVKRNYDGEGVSEARVAENRAKYQSSVTVMFQREGGYDLDNKNWFWAKYYPDGKLYQKPTPKGSIHMAGRIAKGKTRDDNRGCIYCHSSAGGGDYIFYPEIKIPRH